MVDTEEEEAAAEEDEKIDDEKDENNAETSAEKEDDKITLSKEELEQQLEEVKQAARATAEQDFLARYKPNEQRGENIKLHKKNEQLEEKLKSASPAEVAVYLLDERVREQTGDFIKKNQEILSSPASISKFQAKIATSANQNPLVDLTERLDNAFWLSHREEIIASRVKQARLESELARQKADEIVEGDLKPTAGKPAREFTPAQRNVADFWGVKL